MDSLDLRGTTTSGGFRFLDGTMEEVGEISLILLESDIPSDLYCDNEGSESRFKLLTGTDANLLHVATHGFYYADKRFGHSVSPERLFRDLNLHFTTSEIETIDEDKMLTRSGLIMAGANNVIKKVPVPKGVDDGVMYAGEIAHLNLSNVNLLVLSACQSGLGEIASCEGVFGLQRAFKSAGVGSIVMSLWNVNDRATRILMETFYRNLLLGQDRRQALINAQSALRSYEDGRYSMPEYWAAFVLLDGLE